MTAKSSISLTRDHGISTVLQQGNEALVRAALAEVLENRRSDRFLSAKRMDCRLSRMIARKRRANAVRG